MNIKILKKSTFWVGFLILFVPFVVPIYLPNDSSARIVIFLVFSLIYYSHCILVEKETERDKAFTREQKENELKKYFASKDKENIERILSFCDIINNFFDNNLKQRIRSNIFLFETNLNSYKIYAQYNMLRYPDYQITIPKNKGCTGEAWLTKNQVWANRDQIFDGLHRLTLEEKQKLDKDLHWVCSTPILRTKRNGETETIAVFNIDGNQPINDDNMIKKVQETAMMIVNILEKYDIESLKDIEPHNNQ